jgi:hypothetical protein
MKLIYCINCHDVIALYAKKRKCICGLSWGHYVDNINAVISGPVIPLGFENTSFMEALQNQPKKGMGVEFRAFVIPEEVPSIITKKI